MHWVQVEPARLKGLFMQLKTPHFTLLQARNPGDPVRREEQLAFADRLKVSIDQIHAVDILTEDLHPDRLDEHDSRMEERLKEDASKQPSLKLTKAVEETEYELAQKITGLEDPRTSVPCEPAGLSTGDRKQKKK